jgi:hypothetical protein
MTMNEHEGVDVIALVEVDNERDCDIRNGNDTAYQNRATTSTDAANGKSANSRTSYRAVFNPTHGGMVLFDGAIDFVEG